MRVPGGKPALSRVPGALPAEDIQRQECRHDQVGHVDHLAHLQVDRHAGEGVAREAGELKIVDFPALLIPLRIRMLGSSIN
jgi:hypothetical protein